MLDGTNFSLWELKVKSLPHLLVIRETNGMDFKLVLILASEVKSAEGY